MPVRASIEPLDWESRFFCLPAAKLCFADHAPVLTLQRLAHYTRVQAKIPAGRSDWLDALQQLEFRLVESECDFLLPVPDHSDDAGAEVANSADIPQLRHMAASVFTHSRFRAPWYQPADSGRFYACWLEKAVLGTFDDQCLLIRNRQQQCQGFVTLRQLNQHQARIGLLAGAGFGNTLIQAARYWCAQRDIRQLYVATQAANIAAMRRYIESGGNVQTTAYWLYR